MSFLSRNSQPHDYPISAHLADFHAEVVEAATGIGGGTWRDSAPLPIEIALGYAAFYYWLVGGTKLSGDEHHYEYPSHSAREAARFVIMGVSEKPNLEKAIRKQCPTFDSKLELSLFDAKLPRTHAIWGECVSRFVIIYCRRLASAATGQIGHFQHFQRLYADDFRDLGKQLLSSASEASIIDLLYPDSNE